MDAARLARFRAGVAASHRGLEAMLEPIAGDLDVTAPSLLPGWTVGHVLTHLARNADSMTLALAGAERGERSEDSENSPRMPAPSLRSSAGTT